MSDYPRLVNISRPVSFFAISALLLLSIVGLDGCDSVSGKGQVNSSTGLAGGPKEGKLYIANQGDGSVIAFDRATSAEGNISPARRFPEGLSGQTGIFLDHATDTLYVANTDHNAILIFEGASTLNPAPGAAAATRVISGPQTGLNHPYGVTFDGKRLYVANRENSVVVFQDDCPQPNAMEGNISPCRTLVGGSTTLDFPRALTIDAQKDILYISNMGTNSVLVYDNASKPATQGDLPPSRTIVGHSDTTQTESMLRLPWGIFADSVNDRLYVIKSGDNQPAILIYENASVRSGGTMPERVIFGGNTRFSSPAGLDVDVANDRLYVANNNNTNNGNISVLAFAEISSLCTPAIHICNLTADSALAGEKTGLSSPAGIAHDPENDTTYVSNTSGNTISLFGLEGNLNPIKLNAGSRIRADLTLLQAPSSFYYDKALDRLYVVNFNASLRSTESPPGHVVMPYITVFDQVSARDFNNTAPDWTIYGSTINENGSVQQEIFFPRGIYIDKTRGYLIVLSTYIKTQVLVYDLASAQINVNSPTLLPQKTVTLPCLGAPPPGCSQPPPSRGGILAQVGPGALTANGPTAMAVDEAKGDVYITDKGDNSIVVFNLDTFTETRRITGLNQPYGIFIDTTRDILYVTNMGGATGVDPATGNTVFIYDRASQRTGDIAPDRIISSGATFDPTERLNAPTAPFVDTATDRLFLMNKNQNTILIFDHASVKSGTILPDRKINGSNTLFAFTGNDPGLTGALWVDSRNGKETLFVGQPVDPTCDPATNECFVGALLIFAVEGNVPAGRVWSGGAATLGGPSAIAIDTSKDILYVANQGDPTVASDDSLFAFAGASTAAGNTNSHRTLCSPVGTSCFSPDSRINNPSGLFIDSKQNRLYVSNSQSFLPLHGTVTTTPGSATVNGSVDSLFLTELLAGERVRIGSKSFTVSSVESNTSFTLTAPYSGPTLTAVTAFGASCPNITVPCNAVLVFHNADLADGDAQPNLILTSSALNDPHGLTVDLDRKMMYVANAGTQSISVFKNIDGLGGAILANSDAEIGGSQSQINDPVGIAVDSGRDILYVLNQGAPEVLVFDRASVQNGNVPPTRIISGSNLLARPTSLFIDPGNDLLYVADQGPEPPAGELNSSPRGAIYIFSNASAAQGQADHKTLKGDNTGLNRPVAIFVDTTR